jgi:Cys-tRNA(Pro)/Cys-tRNA(Cys) deacylase
VAAATPALGALARAGVQHRVHTYDHDPSAPSFGREAAEALGVDPGRVFKTLVAKVGDGLVIALVPVLDSLDLKALAGAMGAKRAEMADPAVAERTTGYAVGAISPLGQKKSLPTVVDGAAEAWATVFCSGGRRGLEIEVAPVDLVRLTGAKVAAIARR